MEIVNTLPPIWEEAHKHFEINDDETFYTYGNKLYNPARLNVPPEILAHEETHMRQQQKTEGGPAGWWAQYFENKAFRADQEAEAYANQYEEYCKNHKDRNQRAKYIYELASHLSSPLYKLGITHQDATIMIKHHYATN